MSVPQPVLGYLPQTVPDWLAFVNESHVEKRGRESESEKTALLCMSNICLAMYDHARNKNEKVPG